MTAIAARPVPQIALDFLRGAEACVLRVYDDAQPNVILTAATQIIGRLTAGWGHTGGLSVGQTVSLTQAVLWLNTDAAIAAARLAGRVKAEVIATLSDHQYGALISFVFNLGANPKWTIWKRLNAGALADVPAQMSRFNKEEKGGKLVEVEGLDNRRAAEIALWKTPDVAAAVVVAQAAPVAPPPSSVTRAASTPPTPAPKPKTGLSAHIVSGLGIVGAACAQGVQPIKDAAKQLAAFTDAPIIAHVVTILLTVAGIATLVGIASSEIQRRQAHQ